MEKLIRNRFEKAVQDVTLDTRNILEEEFRAVLESNRPYQNKCDYICNSINAVDNKVALLDDEIEQLQNYRENLEVAKQMALETGAIIFKEYGIHRIEGLGFSSITISKAMQARSIDVTVIDEEELIDQGFYKKVIDEQKILESYMNNEYRDFINQHAKVENVLRVKLATLQVNRRTVVNNGDYGSTNIPKVDDIEDAS